MTLTSFKINVKVVAYWKTMISVMSSTSSKLLYIVYSTLLVVFN